MNSTDIHLGDVVVDTVSKFEGIALAKQISVHEATQFRVHPCDLDSNGAIRGSHWIEASRLKLISAKNRTGFHVDE